MAIERPHEKYGSAIYVKPNLVITSTKMTENNDIDIQVLAVNIGSITITSVYKPPTIDNSSLITQIPWTITIRFQQAQHHQ